MIIGYSVFATVAGNPQMEILIPLRMGIVSSSATSG
jgi:hypothetical protein